MEMISQAAMHLAAEGSHTGVVKLLLRKSASIEAGDNHAVTPLCLHRWPYWCSGVTSQERWLFN